MTPHLRISELASPPLVEHLQSDIDALNPNPTESEYWRQKRLKDLLVAMQDIHLLAMGVQEILERLESLEVLLSMPTSLANLSEAVLDLLKRVKKLEGE